MSDHGPTSRMESMDPNHPVPPAVGPRPDGHIDDQTVFICLREGCNDKRLIGSIALIHQDFEGHGKPLPILLKCLDSGCGWFFRDHDTMAEHLLMVHDFRVPVKNGSAKRPAERTFHPLPYVCVLEPCMHESPGYGYQNLDHL